MCQSTQTYYPDSEPTTVHDQMCQSTQTYYPDSEPTTVHEQMCQSTQTYYHDSEPTCLCSYFLIHLYCVLRAEETNTYFIVCFVPTEGSNLQSTALFPLTPLMQLQTSVEIQTNTCNLYNCYSVFWLAKFLSVSS